LAVAAKQVSDQRRIVESEFQKGNAALATDLQTLVGRGINADIQWRNSQDNAIAAGGLKNKLEKQIAEAVSTEKRYFDTTNLENATMKVHPTDEELLAGLTKYRAALTSACDDARNGGDRLLYLTCKAELQ
jgi:hypothetical protein